MSPVQWKIQRLMAQITKFAAAWTFPQLLEQPGWTQGAPMNLIKPDKNPQKKQLMGSFARSPPVINFMHWRSGAGEQLGQGRADGNLLTPIFQLSLESLHSSSTEIPRARTAQGSAETLWREGFGSFASLQDAGAEEIPDEQHRNSLFSAQLLRARGWLATLRVHLGFIQNKVAWWINYLILQLSDCQEVNSSLKPEMRRGKSSTRHHDPFSTPKMPGGKWKGKIIQEWSEMFSHLTFLSLRKGNSFSFLHCFPSLPAPLLLKFTVPKSRYSLFSPFPASLGSSQHGIVMKMISIASNICCV